jgi:hypothetical protein
MFWPQSEIIRYYYLPKLVAVLILILILKQLTVLARPLGRPRHRWVDNIKMDLREIGWDGVDWIDTAQDRDQ